MQAILITLTVAPLLNTKHKIWNTDLIL